MLCIGDSVTFGGVQTDQQQTYPYDLQKDLNQRSHGHYEVLNESTGGWALANEEGYISKFGVYNSQIVVEEIGTNDLTQPFAPENTVGTISYPDHKPLLGLQELVMRYILPRVAPTLFNVTDPGVNIHQNISQFKANLAIIRKMKKDVNADGAKMVVIFMKQPTFSEPTNPTTVFEEHTLFKTLTDLNIPFISPSAEFIKEGDANLFRDGVHPNPLGDKLMAKSVATLIP